MKEVRQVVPHRSNSVIEDWISKGILATSSGIRTPDSTGPGTGKLYEFEGLQVVDAGVIDQYSTLGLLSKPYAGPNLTRYKEDQGNVRECFMFPRQSGEPRAIYAANFVIDVPQIRTRENALAYYRKFDCKVLISIHLKRRAFEGKLSKKDRERLKVGQVDYHVMYFPEATEFWPSPKRKSKRKSASSSLINNWVNQWRNGTTSQGVTLCMISVDLIRQRVERLLDVNVL